MTENDKTKWVWLSPIEPDDGVRIQFREDHIHIRLSEALKVDSERRTSLWDRIGRLCAEHGTRRVLVEGRLPEGDFETTEVVDAGLKTATVPSLWMAFCLQDFVPNELSELYETVAASRGVRVKHFADTERALMWLRNNTPA